MGGGGSSFSGPRACTACAPPAGPRGLACAGGQPLHLSPVRPTHTPLAAVLRRSVFISHFLYCFLPTRRFLCVVSPEARDAVLLAAGATGVACMRSRVAEKG